MHTASPFCILMDEEPVEEWKHTFYPKEKLRLTVAFLVNRQIQEAGVMPFSGTLDFIYEIHPASDVSKTDPVEPSLMLGANWTILDFWLVF